MKKNSITTIHRAIAYILFTSQILTSCVKPVPNPHPEALLPIANRKEQQQSPQKTVVIVGTHQTEATRPDSRKLNHNLEPTIITNTTERPPQAITITQSIERKKMEQMNYSLASTPFTEQVQQELHKSIEQTLANPI